MDCSEPMCHSGDVSINKKRSLKRIVDIYIKANSGNLNKFLQKFNSIIDCICGDIGNVDNPKDRKFKKHKHQYRLKYESIIGFRKALNGIDKENFSSFEELFNFVNNIREEGIGPLAKYDFCLRYGFSRGLTPQVVYVHSGTATGAKALKKHGYIKKVKNEMPVSDFPAELHKLEPMHIENLLCIYDEALDKLPNK